MVSEITKHEVDVLYRKLRADGFPERCFFCESLHLDVTTGGAWCDEDTCKGWKDLYNFFTWGE
jgi:hypothetical protein